MDALERRVVTAGKRGKVGANDVLVSIEIVCHTSLRLADLLVLRRQMDVRRLDPDAARPGEAVEDEVPGPAEHAGLQSVDRLLHRDALVAVDPTARLDVDLLALLEHLVEDVAVAAEPDDPLE